MDRSIFQFANNIIGKGKMMIMIMIMILVDENYFPPIDYNFYLEFHTTIVFRKNPLKEVIIFIIIIIIIFDRKHIESL